MPKIEAFVVLFCQALTNLVASPLVMAFAIKLITSPIKITCQLATGNFEGASETTKDVIVTTPVISHVAAGVVKIGGNDEAAAQLWHDSNRNLNSITNSIPLVGHTKGLLHYACNDVEGGQEAIQSANRSTAAVAEGVGDLLIAIPNAGVSVAAAGAKIGNNVMNTGDRNSTSWDTWSNDG